MHQTAPDSTTQHKTRVRNIDQVEERGNLFHPSFLYLS